MEVVKETICPVAKRLATRSRLAVGAARIALAALVSSCGSTDRPSLDDIPVSYNVSPDHPLAHVRAWDLIISRVNDGNRIERLAQSGNDLVVISDERMSRGEHRDYDPAVDIAKLHATSGVSGKKKIVLVYLNVGEAEEDRTYWKKGWKVGSPDWIVGRDPDNFNGAFPVAFWRSEWQELLFGGAESALSKAVAAGFDGVYMDWIEAAFFKKVIERAKQDGVDVRDEMTKLVRTLRDKARAVNPRFLVVAQNGTQMRKVPGYLELLDGESQEQVYFDGLPNVTGDDPRQGDCQLPLRINEPPPATNADYCNELVTMRASSEQFVRSLVEFTGAGVPVFIIDYALQPANARYAYAQHAKHRFVGLVKMRSVDNLSATPSPALGN